MKLYTKLKCTRRFYFSLFADNEKEFVVLAKSDKQRVS